jgi:hypothetical protein
MRYTNALACSLPQPESNVKLFDQYVTQYLYDIPAAWSPSSSDLSSFDLGLPTLYGKAFQGHQRNNS